MSDIVLELALKRSSGVLAGIVASLAQAGLELQSQKLDRSGSGWLTIRASGDAPDPGMLSERMALTRGVERLMRLEVDGDAVIADGELIVEEIENRIELEDLAALTRGSDRTPGAAAAEDSSHFSLEEVELGTEHGPEPKLEPEPEPTPQPATGTTQDVDLPPVEAEAEAVGDAHQNDDEATDFDSDERVETRPMEPAERMQTAMRRRRRRRR